MNFTESGIVDVTPNLVWAEGRPVLFYTVQDPETLRWHEVWRHELGADGEDTRVFSESDDRFYVFVSKTKSRKYLTINSSQTLATEYRVLPADEPMGEWSVFEPRERGHEYEIDHASGRWVIRSNWEANNFRLMEAAQENTARENWREIVAHRSDVMLEYFELFRGFCCAWRAA